MGTLTSDTWPIGTMLANMNVSQTWDRVRISFLLIMGCFSDAAIW